MSYNSWPPLTISPAVSSIGPSGCPLWIVLKVKETGHWSLYEISSLFVIFLTCSQLMMTRNPTRTLSKSADETREWFQHQKALYQLHLKLHTFPPRWPRSKNIGFSPGCGLGRTIL
jgi:hypothetical protein